MGDYALMLAPQAPVVRKRGISAENFRPLDYQGLWYTVQSTTTPFEADCDGSTAFYQWDAEQQKLQITNSCVRDNRVVRQVQGVATIRDKGPPLILEVDFGQAGPPMPGGYWLLDTDYKNFALVGSRGTFYGTRYEYLWLLARTPEVDELSLYLWKEKALSHGFSPANLEPRNSRVRSDTSCLLL